MNRMADRVKVCIRRAYLIDEVLRLPQRTISRIPLTLSRGFVSIKWLYAKYENY